MFIYYFLYDKYGSKSAHKVETANTSILHMGNQREVTEIVYGQNQIIKGKGTIQLSPEFSHLTFIFSYIIFLFTLNTHLIFFNIIIKVSNIY